MEKTFAEKLVSFYKTLKINEILPEGINIMNPYQENEVLDLTRIFMEKFYKDSSVRTAIFGINPGRFGAGVTGITFTDPIRLENNCGIKNHLQKKPELSSVFIYEMIDRFGGPEKFYRKFFLSAICPLGFIKNNKNLNYYDDKILEKTVRPFIITAIKKHIKLGCSTETALCLGEGKNYLFLAKLNEEYRFFEKIIPLAHPRFIMQYRMKRKEEYIKKYLDAFKSIR